MAFADIFRNQQKLSGQLENLHRSSLVQSLRSFGVIILLTQKTNSYHLNQPAFSNFAVTLC